MVASRSASSHSRGEICFSSSDIVWMMIHCRSGLLKRWRVSCNLGKECYQSCSSEVCKAAENGVFSPIELTACSPRCINSSNVFFICLRRVIQVLSTITTQIGRCSLKPNLPKEISALSRTKREPIPRLHR